MKNHIMLISVIFSCASFAQAEFSKAKCDHVLTGNNLIQVNRQWDDVKRNCFISVTPRNIVNLKYRDYYFDTSGRFMVFNSYGAGPSETSTGARDFFLFPITEDYPDYSFEPNQDVIIKLVSGHQLRISGKDFSLVSLSNGTVKEKPLSSKNNGGVEIKLTKGFWLDAGFRLGGLNIANPDKLTVFQTGKSSTGCSLKNNIFMDYKDKENPEFKFIGDPFVQFIKSQCPKLLF